MKTVTGKTGFKLLFKTVGKSLGLRVNVFLTLWIIAALAFISVVSLVFYRQSNNDYMERVVESDIILDNKNRVARFRVMGNIDETRAGLDKFKTTLLLYLSLFGVASILINLVIIYISLRPLQRIQHSLADIRAGKANHLDTDLPLEVMPLVGEMNALIDNNQRIVERFRVQVGNLAHSLKTPLSVMGNEIDQLNEKNSALSSSSIKLLKEQTGIMRAQIERYLQRARIAAQRDSVIYRTPLRPLLERLVRVMGKLYLSKEITFSMNEADIIFIGEKEDIEEMVGNILENACKWAQKHVVLRCETANDKMREASSVHPMFELSVEDDGPGLPINRRHEALERGKRLDESKPGTGLGLSIVAELVGEYDGNVELSVSKLGGLCVTLRLPYANS